MPRSSDLSTICILGGGTAGWMTAAGLANKFSGLGISITLVESDQIGTVGVGEATLPHIRNYNMGLGIDERRFMRETQATFKLGIEFCDWGRVGDRYVHPFGVFGMPVSTVEFHHHWLRLRDQGNKTRLDDYSLPILMAEQAKFQRPGSDHTKIDASFGYAYQFDSSLYARFLRNYAEERGVKRLEGKAVSTALDPETGHVASITLEDGETIPAELFVDCSGFRGVLIEQALQTGYDDWSEWLPCNRAVAVPCESRPPLSPFTRATARKAGWQWRIPLQHRTGNGHVYWNEHISDDEAAQQLLGSLEGPALADVNQLYFQTGRRRKFWNKNVVAIGLSSGFLEPLESTSIHLIQEGVTKLIELFPNKEFRTSDIDEYNRLMGLNFERVRDFLLLHYVATQRDDSEMWRYFRNLTLPDSLQEKIDAWLTRAYIIKYEFGVFLPPSWLAVMLGQNLVPTAYDPRANATDIDTARAFAQRLLEETQAAVDRMPGHGDFLAADGSVADAAATRATQR